jgi:hypothetical protein
LSRFAEIRGGCALYNFCNLPQLGPRFSDFPRACNEKGKTRAEMNECASNELARVEAQMDDIYNTLLSKTASQPEALAKIKVAQKPDSFSGTPTSPACISRKINKPSMAPCIRRLAKLAEPALLRVFQVLISRRPMAQLTTT